MNCTQIQELAAAYALGALDPAEASRLEAMAAADRDLRAELDSFLHIARRLAQSVPPVAPPPGVRSAVLARIARTPQLRADTPSPNVPPVVPPGFKFLRPATGRWTEGPVPGVRVQMLSTDWRRNQTMLYIELDPGARYPDHRHSGPEQMFIVSGDLRSGGLLLHAGDFVEGQEGSDHCDVVSPSGCQALLVTSATSAMAQFTLGKLKEVTGKLTGLRLPDSNT